MKTKLIIIFILIACFSIAQTPAPTGTWYKNATQKEKIQIKGVAVLDANNVLNGYYPIDSLGGDVDLSNYYTKTETDSVVYRNNVYVNVLETGAVGDGITYDSDAIQAAIDLASTGQLKRVYIPEGVYIIDKTIYVPSNIEIFGSGTGTTILKNSSTSNTLDLITPVAGLNANHAWRTMLSTEGSSSTENLVENITIKDLTVDWNDVSGGSNSVLPIMIANCTNCKIDEIELLDALDPSINNMTVNKRGFSILFTNSYDSEITNSIIHASDYESVAIRSTNENIKVRNNVFFANKPQTYQTQLHCIQTAIFAGGDLTKFPLNTTIEGNTFYFQSKIRHAFTAHTSTGVFVYNNLVKVVEGFNEQVVGFKPFDNTHNVVIQGNVIDFRNYNANHFGSFAISIGTVVPESVIMRNIKIDNNQILYKNLTPFSGTPFYQGSSIIGGFQTYADNVSITNNSIEIDGYDNTNQTIIGASGTNINVSGNTITLKNPFEAINGTSGFILLNSWGGDDISFSNNIVTGVLSRGIIIENKTTPLETMKIFDNTFTSIGDRIDNQTGEGTVQFGIETVNGNFPDENGNIVVSGGGGGLELGETSSTAYRGDRGKIAYDYSQVPRVASAEKGANNGVATLNSSGKIPNTQLNILPSDFGLNLTSIGYRVPVTYGDTNIWTTTFATLNTSAAGSTILVRNSSGQAVFTAGTDSTHGATVGQVNSASWQNGLSVYTFNSDASWTESGSLNITLNSAIPEAIWTGAYGVEIWWNEGAGATAYKRTLEHYLGQDLIAINSINRSSSGQLVVSLDVMMPFTIPAGAKLIIKKLP